MANATYNVDLNAVVKELEAQLGAQAVALAQLRVAIVAIATERQAVQDELDALKATLASRSTSAEPPAP